MATATYIYCLVQSARKPSTARAPRRLRGATPAVSTELAARLWLVHSQVPLDQYGPGPLEASLKDRSTLILDERTPPFDLLNGVGVSAPKAQGNAPQSSSNNR